MYSRPELGTPHVGDKVLIIRHYQNRGEPVTPAEAEVIKVGPVWLTIKETGVAYPFEWHMRRATQHTGDKDNYYDNDGFVTPEQYAWDQRIRLAREYLAEISLKVDWDSPWKYPENTILLANLLRTHYGLPEL